MTRALEPRALCGVAGVLVLVFVLWSLARSQGSTAGAESSLPPTAGAAPVARRARVARPDQPARRARSLTAPTPMQAPATIRFADVLDVSDEHGRLLMEAEEVAVAECMRARNFDYVEVPYVSDAEITARRGTPAVGDVEAARTSGYGLVAQRERGEQPHAELDPNDRVRAGLDPARRAAWLEALAGTAVAPDLLANAENDPNYAVVESPQGTVIWDRRGCWAEAREAVHGDDEGFYALQLRIRELRREAKQDAELDAEVTSARVAWRQCMAGRGTPVASPEAARDAVADELDRDEDLSQVRAHELRIATADAECNGISRLRLALEHAIARAEQRVEADHQETLAAYATQHAEALTRAEQLLHASAE